MPDIGYKEASKRIACIELIESQISSMQKDLYNRKANLLQTHYDFKMEKIDLPYLSYTDNTFSIDENIFCDIDDALEFALTNHNPPE